MMPFLPLTIAGSSGPCVVDARYCRIQEPLFVHQQQTATTSQPMATTNRANPSHFITSVQNQNRIGIIPDMYPPGSSISPDQYVSDNLDAIAARKRCLDNNSTHFSRPQVTMPSWQTDSISAEQPDSSCNAAAARSFTLEPNISATLWDDDLSKSLLSFLISDRPMMTEEQVKLERAAMTDEEKSEALTDLFGKQCAVDIRNVKRARRDLTKDAIDFLVKQMRLELERMPKDEKRALMEAETNCLADEFSDVRLERFLRCEGMNVKVRLREDCIYVMMFKAANLLVCVWELSS
jgi:hypothetical protein